MISSGWSSSRLIRIVVAFFFCIAVGRLLVSVWDHRCFQRHLQDRYIGWNRFPSLYSDTLQLKNPKLLERDKFDYSQWFPPYPGGNSSTTIPRSIHFIWFKDLYKTRPDSTDIPSTGSNTPELCRKHNPSYNITIWDAQEGRKLIEGDYAWFLPTYDGYRYPIQRIDVLKYFILWHHGGVYMDLDISCRRPLEPLLEFPAWFPEASPMGVNNDLMASRPRHPILSLMLENLANRNRNLVFPYLTIFWSTGPRFAGDMLKKWDLEHHAIGFNGWWTGPDDWFVLPRMFYSEEYTFFGHRPGGSWHGQDVATVMWLVAHPALLCIVVLTTVFGSALARRLWRRRKDRICGLAESRWREGSA